MSLMHAASYSSHMLGKPVLGLSAQMVVVIGKKRVKLVGLAQRTHGLLCLTAVSSQPPPPTMGENVNKVTLLRTLG